MQHLNGIKDLEIGSMATSDPELYELTPAIMGIIESRNSFSDVRSKPLIIVSGPGMGITVDYSEARRWQKDHIICIPPDEVTNIQCHATKKVKGKQYARPFVFTGWHSFKATNQELKLKGLHEKRSSTGLSGNSRK